MEIFRRCKIPNTVEEAVRIITGGAPELAVEGNGPVESNAVLTKAVKRPNEDSDEDEEKGLSSLPFMTFTERGSRSGFGEAGTERASEGKLFIQDSFCLLSHMFQRDNALLQGSWKQSCIVIGASVIWFLRKPTNQPM